MRLAVPFVMIAAFGLAACDGGASATLPDGVTSTDVALFKTAVADAGCAVADASSAETVETQTGFTDDKLRAITQYLTLAGESEPLAVGFRLTSGQCANA